jgi:phosphonoacetate hydrolase
MSSALVNGRLYRVPERPSVLICLDGSDPAYLEEPLPPLLASWKKNGTWLTAKCAMPSFTNPNNVSIVTGAPPALHGISGNHFYDPATKRDVQMTAREYLRAPTILEALSAQDVRVLSVTAKRKLIDLIAPGRGGRAFSAEENGCDVYSPEASYFVLDAGIRALEAREADLIYLSTTDYVQHKHAPGSREAVAFYRGIDERLARMDALGADILLTADHGMNDKTKPDGSPNVVYLGDRLPGAHVTLPITDPYVVHHGALGGCAMIHLDDLDREHARSALEGEPGVEHILSREEAAVELELPADRIGDLIVLAAKDAVLGKRADDHDLSHVARGLRSHGSLHEQTVPLIMNRRITVSRGPLIELRNWDALDLLLNSARA